MTTVLSPAQVRQIIATTIGPFAKPTHDLAVVGSVDAQGAQVVATFIKATPAGNWELAGVARHNWGGDNLVGAFFMFSR